MKKILTMSAITASMLLLVGCGSSSSVETGTANYLDSAVSGVNYKCGNQEGITGANGEFMFEKGQSCTFYLGDVKLRDIDTSLLQDGAKIVEDDIQIATLLQSLDVDGNPDNGITLTPEVVEAVVATLQEDGESKLPSTPEEIEALVASVESSVADFEGHVVTEEEAQAHLNKTNTIVLLDGTTFYINYEDGDEEGTRYIKATFTKTEIEAKEYDKDAELIHSGTESYISPIQIISAIFEKILKRDCMFGFEEVRC